MIWGGGRRKNRKWNYFYYYFFLRRAFIFFFDFLQPHHQIINGRPLSLLSEICRTLRIQVGCIHARTTKTIIMHFYEARRKLYYNIH